MNRAVCVMQYLGEIYSMIMRQYELGSLCDAIYSEVYSAITHNTNRAVCVML